MMNAHLDFSGTNEDAGDVLAAIRRLIASRSAPEEPAPANPAAGLRATDAPRLVLNVDTLVAPDEVLQNHADSDSDRAGHSGAEAARPAFLSIPQALADFANFVSDEGDGGLGQHRFPHQKEAEDTAHSDDVVAAFPISSRQRVVRRFSQEVQSFHPAHVADQNDAKICDDMPAGPFVDDVGEGGAGDTSRDYLVMKALGMVDLPRRSDRAEYSVSEVTAMPLPEKHDVPPPDIDEGAAAATRELTEAEELAATVAFPDDLHLRLFSPDDADLPTGSALRTLIRDVIRGELQGETGGRFGNNLRHLIQVEVASAIVAQTQKMADILAATQKEDARAKAAAVFVHERAAFASAPAGLG